jgi:transposase-like protein
VVDIFPGRDAIIRLVCAVLADQNDEWTESRHLLSRATRGEPIRYARYWSHVQMSRR